MKLTDFDVYKDILQDSAGLLLSEDKIYTLESRLSPVAKQLGFATFSDMTQALNGVPEPSLIQSVTEAMLDYETNFFHDGAIFKSFQDYALPYMVKSRRRKRRLNIWSAGCASGQEPYTIVMILKQAAHKHFLGWDTTIRATDISQKILDTARRGIYTQNDVQRGLPVDLLLKNFKQRGDEWHINADIKSNVKFRQHNILRAMPRIDAQDIIFCCSVLSAFDCAMQKDIVMRMLKRLSPDGIIILCDGVDALSFNDVLSPINGHDGLYARPKSKHFKTSFFKK